MSKVFPGQPDSTENPSQAWCKSSNLGCVKCSMHVIAACRQKAQRAQHLGRCKEASGGLILDEMMLQNASTPQKLKPGPGQAPIFRLQTPEYRAQTGLNRVPWQS